MQLLYKLPTALRAELKAPLAPVLQTPEAVDAVNGRFLVAVGDVCSERFLEAGVTPRIILGDWGTQRGAIAAAGHAGEGLRELRALHAAAATRDDVHVTRVTNPAATITRALWDAIEAAVARAGTTFVEVDGEEDLAVLPALVLAPDDAVVAYGQPDAGVVIVPVNEKTRARARELLAQMRVETDTSQST